MGRSRTRSANSLPTTALRSVLRYVDELSVPDVARELGRSVHATESLLVRARAALRDVVVHDG